MATKRRNRKKRNSRRSLKQIALLLSGIALLLLALVIVPRTLRSKDSARGEAELPAVTVYAPGETEEPEEEPAVTEAPPAEVKLKVNDLDDGAQLGPEVEQICVTWSSDAPVAGWRFTLRDEEGYRVSSVTDVSDALDSVIFERSLLADGVYNATVTAVDDARIEGRLSFELLSEHVVRQNSLSTGMSIIASLHEGRIALKSNDETKIEELFPDTAWQDWEDLVQVSVREDHLVALDSSGRVYATGAQDAAMIRCDGVEHIKWIAAGDACTICVRDNGRLGLYGSFGEAYADLAAAENVAQVSLSDTHVLLLMEDGTARAIPRRPDGPLYEEDVAAWNSITAIAAGHGYSLGLKADGSVCYAGDPAAPEAGAALWTDIAGFAAGNGYALGVTRQGTVVQCARETLKFVDTGTWRDIVAVGAGFYCCVGLHEDGTLEISAL